MVILDWPLILVKSFMAVPVDLAVSPPSVLRGPIERAVILCMALVSFDVPQPPNYQQVSRYCTNRKA